MAIRGKHILISNVLLLIQLKVPHTAPKAGRVTQCEGGGWWINSHVLAEKKPRL